MTIPKLHYISQGISARAQLENIQKACASGIELVLLCLKNIPERDCLKFAKEVKETTAHFQARLIISEHYKTAKTIKADGVHLGKSGLCPTVVRAYLHTWQMIGGTANTLQDCKTLISKEVDYINLGPFRITANKENLSPALGLNGTTAIIETLKTEIPIIGFGNITTEDVAEILKTGISGIAVSEAIMSDFNSIKIFNQLLEASSTKEQRYTLK